MLTGLNQKVRGMVGVFVCHSTRSMIPPADRQTLTHRVKPAEHGKPNCLHLGMEGDSRGKPIGEWVKEVGESECWSVMDRIGVQNLPDTKVCRIPTGVESREMYANM